MSAKRRSDLEITRDVLQYLAENPEGAKRTRLMYATNLSWKPVLKILDSLGKRDLIRIMGPPEDKRSSNMIVLTERGHKMLFEMQTLFKSIRS